MESRRSDSGRDEASDRETIRVLLVDDNAEDRATIAKVVSRDVAPVEVDEILDHVGFYQALQENRFDIVITEQDLHWSSGLEVLTAVKSLRPGVPVIMVAGDESIETATKALREGVEAYLPKAGALEARLRASLRSALQKLEFEDRIGDLEQRIQDVLERLDVGVFRATTNGVLLERNSAFDRLVGSGDGGEGPAALDELFVDLETHDDLVVRLAEDGEVRSFQAPWRHRDGSLRWVSLAATVRSVPAGDRVVEGLVEDVTVVRSSLEAVARARDDLRAIFEHSGAAIAVLESDGTIAMVNSAFEKFSGYGRAELEGTADWGRFMSIADGERLAERRRVLLTAPESGPRSGQFEFRTRDGRSHQVHSVEAVLPGSDRTVVSLVNITERLRIEDRLLHNAFHDGLTGAPNRLSLMNRLEALLNGEADARRDPTALVLLDLDGFKGVNGQFGQRIGDLLLRSVARRMESVVGDEAVVARSGSDTFAVIVSPVSGEDEAMEIAREVSAALAEPFRFGERTVRCTTSVGVSVSTADTTAGELFQNTETALYDARRRGGNQIILFGSKPE